MSRPFPATGALDAEDLASALDGHPDFRVLRRIRPMRRDRVAVPGLRLLAGCALDVETTGLDHRRDAVIELALQRFWADAAGRIVVTGRRHSWLEDPRRELTPDVIRLTGLRPADLAGRGIVDAEAASLIADADFVVAHNAGFDRPFVESRLPAAAGSPWICSMRDMDWVARGYEGRSLSQLLTQMGWFYDPHRAQTDVTALLHLLDHPLPGGGTVLAGLVSAAVRPTWLIRAEGAPYEAKDLLKSRGYRWDPDARLWSREVGMSEFDDEFGWATVEVYGGLRKPAFRQITWRERYAAATERLGSGAWGGARA